MRPLTDLDGSGAASIALGLAALPHHATPDVAAADIEASHLIYAIGDIHGRHDLLTRMLRRIEADTVLPKILVFLGDVVNRGPHTRMVLDRLIQGPDRPTDRWIVLRGNHEQAMLDALISPDGVAISRWLKRGGMQALGSYGATGKDVAPSRARTLVGPRHLAFLASLPLTHLAGGYLFVHAGVAPRVQLVDQPTSALMTIRARFLKKRHGLPYTIVHGHTPTDGEPLLGPGRIGIDTGAYATGILTCLAIDMRTNRRRFLAVRGPAG
ncbi:metallophosphoesterase family protein [Rhodopila sp.]|uniref:metallophosphoesterase family protein n=1 Tax=Rhodopila sp. TaxID=2480087 RepID=UPI002BA2F661|nr:metallophosphoesterase family protein [Rhodopila sp.]HVZ06314.1 metallophosphoesterase family protein [Rhodopila sp.]